MIPYEDKVDVITPINILFIGGGEIWSLMKIKLMLLPQSTYCSYGVAKFDTSWRYSWCYYPNQHIVHRGWRILTPHEDKDDNYDDGDDDDDDDDDDCKTSGLGQTCLNNNQQETVELGTNPHLSQVAVDTFPRLRIQQGENVEGQGTRGRLRRSSCCGPKRSKNYEAPKFTRGWLWYILIMSLFKLPSGKLT